MHVYDDLGNLRKEVSPDRGTTLYGYDAAGNLTCKADGRHSGGAATCEAATNRWVYQYDALNRLISTDYPETPGITDIWVEEQVRLGTLPAKSGPVLRAVLYAGQLERGQVPAIVDTGDRQARRIVSALVELGVLTSSSSRAALRLAFPAKLVPRWLPGLFPESGGA